MPAPEKLIENTFMTVRSLDKSSSKLFFICKHSQNLVISKLTLTFRTLVNIYGFSFLFTPFPLLCFGIIRQKFPNGWVERGGSPKSGNKLSGIP